MNFRKFLSLFLVFVFTLTSFNFNVLANSSITYNIDDFNIKNFSYSDAYSSGELKLGHKNVDITWGNANFKEGGMDMPTTYYLARRKINPLDNSDYSGEYSWKLRGNYGRYGEEIRVLNVYPGRKGSDGFKSWMDNIEDDYPGSKSNIVTTAVDILDFNKNPQNYLYKDDHGIYNYDVVVFGFWDSYNSKDLSTHRNKHGYSSYEVMQDYIDMGYGVIFGHDTLSYLNAGRDVLQELILNNMNFAIEKKDFNKWHRSDKIGIYRQSTLNTFPFDITGKELIIPTSHVLNQIPLNEDEIYLSFEKNYYVDGEGPFYEKTLSDDGIEEYEGEDYFTAAYLTINENTALIQSGHSSGKTSSAEQAVLANTVYALIYKIFDNTTMDRVMDTARPSSPIPKISETDNANLEFTAFDTGSQYEYRIIAQPEGYGDSVVKNFDVISNHLNNNKSSSFAIENINGGSNLYAISNLSTTEQISSGVKGSIGTESDKRAYEYYVDRNPLGEKRDEYSGTKFIEYGSTYEIKDILEGFKDGDYLHIWSYDNANNQSIQNTLFDTASETTKNGINYSINNGITNIELWHTKPFFDVYVKHQDSDGNELLPSETYSYIEDEHFSSTPKQIDGYQYINSLPDKDIIVMDNSSDPTINTITHTYGEIFVNNVYTVRHHNLGEADYSKKIEQIASESGILNSVYTVTVPDYVGYNYTGFVNADTNYNNETGINSDMYEVVIKENRDYYLHYIQEEGYPKIIIQRENADGTFTEITTYEDTTLQKPLGESVIVNGSDILNQYHSVKTDEDAYTNGVVLSEDVEVLISTEGANEHIISLQPRHKKVRYVGLKYLSHTTENLGEIDFIYNGTDLTETAYANNTDFVDSSIWTPFDATQDRVIDYSVPTDSFIVMSYYDTLEGLPENYNYDFTVNYTNLKDGTSLAPSEDYTGKTTSPSAIKFKEFTDVQIADVPVHIDFELDYVEVISLDTNNTYRFSNNGVDLPIEDIYLYVPEIDDNLHLTSTDYDVNVYYRPITYVAHKEYLNIPYIDEAGNESFDTIKVRNDVISAKYEDTISLPQKSTEIYKLLKVEVDGVEVTDFNFNEVVSNDYVKDVKVYYELKTYDLQKRYIDSFTGEVHHINYHYNTPVGIPTTQKIPVEVGDYILHNITAGSDNVSEEFVELDKENLIITFNPNKSYSEEPYIIDLHYKHEAEVIIEFAKLDKGNEVITHHKEVDTYLGDQYTFNLPLDVSDGTDEYVVDYLYINGKYHDIDDTQENSAKNLTATVTIKNPYNHLFAVYKNKPMYTISTSTTPSNLGVFNGNIDATGDYKLFASDELASISLNVDDGYVLKDWQVTPSDLVYEEFPIVEGSNLYGIFFRMPKSDVEVVAVLEEVEKTRTITVNNTPSYGGSVAIDPAYIVGKPVDLTANPSIDYEFINWVVDSGDLTLSSAEATNENISFIMPDSDIVLTANYELKTEDKKTLTVNTNPIDSGVIEYHPLYSVGETVSLTATSVGDYEFINWVVDSGDLTLSSTEATKESISFVMPNTNVTLTANFKKESGGGSSGGGGGGSNRPIKPTEPIEPEEPIAPTLPENPTDILEFVIDPVQQAIRKYKPYIDGYENNEVRPDGEARRVEIIQAIYNLYGNNYKANQDVLDNFTDLEKDMWYSDAMAFAIEFELIKGFEDGTFHPDENITRAQFVTILSKLIPEDYSNVQAGFTDYENHWAKDAINTVYGKGVTNGYMDGTFRPDALMTRAEFVTMVNRLIERPEEYYTTKTFIDLDTSHWSFDNLMNASNGAVIPLDLDNQYILDGLKDK